MDIIDYRDIISLFDNKWDFSYLTFDEMMEVLNFPIKIAPNHMERLTQVKMDIEKNSIFLIVAKNTEDYDYSLTHYVETLCYKKLPKLKIDNFWCNYKYAAVKSGMGQYAKNSLVYHYKFQFEVHFTVFIIHNKVCNLPERRTSNFYILDLCKNCNDCERACPVNAIHSSNFTWIDMYKCDNFCFFGDHPVIPSIKENHFKLRNYDLSKIHSYEDIPGVDMNSSFVQDGEVHWFQYPTCRECSSQKKCSKYNGNYPYDRNNVKIL